MDPVMCRIGAPSGEGNYLLEIRQFLWNHRSEKETDLVIMAGKESVKVHQAIILPLSDHPIEGFPPSCPCTKPALSLPPFPGHILTAAVEILYIGKATGLASREDHVKIKEVFSFLKIKVDIIAEHFEGGNIFGEHDNGAAAGEVIVKIELTDAENNNSIMLIGQDGQLHDDRSCFINDVKGLIDNDAMRNISEMDKRDEQPSSSSNYLNEVTGQFHYQERRNSLKLYACQNDKTLDAQHSSSARYLDEFSNFISLNRGSGSSFTVPTGASGLELSGNDNTDKIASPTYKRNNFEKVVKTTVSHDTDVKTTVSHDTEEIWNDLKRKNASEGYNFRPSKEEPTSPRLQGPLAKLRPMKRKLNETDDLGIGLDGKNILSVIKAKPGNTKQKISVTTESSKKYPCCKCSYKTNSQSNFRRHIDAVHQKGSLNCNKCDFKTTHKAYLQKHINCVHGNVFYYCQQCEYKTKLKYRLKLHNDSVHENIFHHCDHCDYKTALKCNLKTHIESLHEKISYECDECHYKTTRKDYLKLHIKRKHAGVTYSGYQGNERAANKETFLKGKMLYYCDQCEYKSTRKYRLKEHIDGVHEKNIFHHCDHCVYKTTWKHNLKTHVESVHEKISYECNDCVYKTTRKDCLKMHMKSKHAGVLYSGNQRTAGAVNKETFPRELPVHGEPTSNFQIRTPNQFQDQVVDVSSKSTNSDDDGPVNDEPYERRF